MDIKAIVGWDGRVALEAVQAAGHEEEQGIARFKFWLPEAIDGWDKRIEIMAGSGKYAEMLEDGDAYSLKAAALQGQRLSLQIVATKEEFVWKSDIFGFYVKPSINAAGAALPDSPDLIASIIETVKDGIEEGLAADVAGRVLGTIEGVLDEKQDKELGKGLSANDYTNEDKEKLASLADIDLSGYVEKVEGKGLSTNDYTTEDKLKLEGLDLSGYATSQAMGQALDSKVDKAEGMGLSSNDYTSEEKAKLAALGDGEGGDVDLTGYATTEYVDEGLLAKVDAADGMGLSSNDYTSEEKEKLAGLNSMPLYDGEGSATDGPMTQAAAMALVYPNAANASRQINIGDGAVTSSSYSIAIGANASAIGSNSTAIGGNAAPALAARTGSAQGVAIGTNVNVAGNQSVGIGVNVAVAYAAVNTAAIGYGVSVSEPNVVDIGTDAQPRRIKHVSTPTADSDAATKGYVDTSLSGKVDAADGMGLSSNDYTNEDKAALGGVLAEAKSYTDSELANFVMPSTYKGLLEDEASLPVSSETAGDVYYIVDLSVTSPGRQGQAIWNGSAWDIIVDAQNVPDNATIVYDSVTGEIEVAESILESIAGKVDAVEGMGLSSNDYTNAEKAKLAALGETGDIDLSEYATTNYVDEGLNRKVDAEDGMGLSSNDYTAEDKAKLEGLGASMPLYDAPGSATDGPMTQNAATLLIRPAAGSTAVRVGSTSASTGTSPIAVGTNAQTSANYAIAIGANSTADGANNIAIGADGPAQAGAWASNTYSIAIGTRSKAQALTAIAIGRNATVASGASNSVAIGTSVNATEDNVFDIGTTAIPRRILHVNTPTADSDAATKGYVDTSLSGKVDAVEGKGLSSNDYTTEDKLKLEGLDLSGYATSQAMGQALVNKVDKAAGMGLSTNDYTDEDKEKLDGLGASMPLYTSQGSATDGPMTQDAATKLIHPAAGSTAVQVGNTADIGDQAVAVGYIAWAKGNASTALGPNAKATGSYSIAVGGYGTGASSADAFGSDTMAIGRSAKAAGSGTIVIGAQAGSDSATATYNVVIGDNTKLGSGVTRSVALGSGVTASESYTVDIGTDSQPRRIKHVGTPTADSDAATKGYVDSLTYFAADEAAAEAYSLANPTALVFYPEA
jgi:hypothetical protein